ncbi:MAG: hypothetical protein ACI4J5_01545 [Oscillospiraceae bacterium]
MKLKKILASLTAAALAVSVVAFSPAVSQNLEVSAEGEITLFSEGAIPDGKSAVITLDCSTELQYDWEYMYSSWDIIVKTWSNEDVSGDWTKMGVGGSNQAQYYTEEYITYTGKEIIDGTLTANFYVQPKDVFEVLYVPNENYDVTIKTVKVYDEADGKGNVLYTWTNPDLDTTVYSEKSYTATSIEGDGKNVFKFEGTWNSDNVSGPKASLEFNVTSTDGMGFNLETIDGKSIAANVWVNSGSTYTIALSEIPSCDGIVFTTWGNGSVEGSSYTVTGITVKNDSTKDAVYTLPSSGEEEEEEIPDDEEEEIIEDDKGESDVEIKNNTDVEVSYDTATVLNAVLTADDLQAIADGKSVEVVLNIKGKSSVSDEDKASAATLIIASQTIEQYLDITLTKSVDGVSTALTETAGLVPITVTIPGYTDSKRYFVIRVHDGAPMYLESTVNNGKITFYSDRFSAFVLVSEPNGSESADGTIWTGSANQGISWEWNPVQVEADKCSFSAGDKLIINFNVNNEADYHQLKVMDGDYNVLSSINASEWGTVDVSSSPLTVTLNASDAAKINASGLTITGYDVTITSVAASVSASEPEEKPAEPETPAVNYYTISTDKYTSVSTVSAPEGAVISVDPTAGFTANVYAGGKLIASVTYGGTFVMPASNVTITSVLNGDYGLMLNAKPVSYIYAYDSNMNKITVASSRKSKSDVQITVKLGTKYAGKTVTLYSGRKNTSDKITSAEADSNGNVTFTVELGENYTAVVE